MAFFNPHQKIKLMTEEPQGLAVTLKKYDLQARQWKP